MQRWTTPTPLRMPVDFRTLTRLDLEFLNVHRDQGSFTAFVYINADEDSLEAGREYDRFAGSFTIFAPSECWGGEGHCDWDRGPVSAFDRRPPHHLTPINVSMEVTETIRRLGNPRELVVTVDAARAEDPELAEGVLRFERLTALAYQ